MTRTLPALSVKQPWAALIVHGVKSVEIRSWSTKRRGLVLIHTSKQVDEREEGWQRLPVEAKETVQLRGGVIGMVELVDCVTYRTQAAFEADCSLHLNEPDWFRAPALYGFVLAKARVLPFHEVPGWVKFFSVRMSEREM